MDKEKEGFSYTYSAARQKEIESIRKKYLPGDGSADKMERLRRLDAGVTRKAMTVSLTAGIIGALILGLGMCCVLVWAGSWFIPGIIIGFAGIAVTAAAYPLHVRIAKKEREKIAPEIIRLTDELLK